MDTRLGSIENIPQAVLLSILQAYSGDAEARFTECVVLPFSTSGMSGNNSFYKVNFGFSSSNSAVPSESASWLVKRWTPGGLSLSELDWNQPVEALAWQQGILRTESLPAGVKTPIIGSVIDPGGEVAWVAMQDISQELLAYDRSVPLPAEQLISHTKTILSRLAQFHALWEQSDRQKSIEGMQWLLPLENYLWRNSAVYADIMTIAEAGTITQADSYKQEQYQNLQAFLQWLDPAYLSLVKNLLVNRTQLVDHFSGIPRTLLHGDLDDRNIGLSLSPSGETELVLIDWEWMGCGPGALDVAKLLIHASMMLEPGSQSSEQYWSSELPEHYYESYRTAGGKLVDQVTWQKSYDLALIAQMAWPFPTVIGSIIRAVQGTAPLPKIPGISQEVTRELLAAGLEQRKSINASIMRALHRYFL